MKFKCEWKWVSCPGSAHENAHIDNCGMCAPDWGKVAVPYFCLDWDAYLLYIDMLSEPQKDDLARDRADFIEAEKQAKKEALRARIRSEG